MGVVYVARQLSPERRVALKLITPAFANDEVFRRRFLREATAAAAIEHPHILPVYAAGESNGTLFMAMRLIDGRDLREILRGSAELPLERVERIVGQVGGALDAAHARGLIHRDVKPGNVLVSEQPDVEDADFCYLMDFGVSTWTASSAATITATGQMVGTANYMAPEQIEGGGVDGRTDLYSLGCVLYECLTGSAPFSGRSAPAILYGHLHEQAPAPSSLRPGLPPGVDGVIDRALRKAPEERYSSCRELTQDLRAALTGSTATMPTVTAVRRPSGSPDAPRSPTGTSDVDRGGGGRDGAPPGRGDHRVSRIARSRARPGVAVGHAPAADPGGRAGDRDRHRPFFDGRGGERGHVRAGERDRRQRRDRLADTRRRAGRVGHADLRQPHQHRSDRVDPRICENRPSDGCGSFPPEPDHRCRSSTRSPGSRARRRRSGPSRFPSSLVWR